MIKVKCDTCGKQGDEGSRLNKWELSRGLGRTDYYELCNRCYNEVGKSVTKFFSLRKENNI